MPTKRNDVLEAVEREFHRFGVSFTLSRTSRHYRVTWHHGGRRRVYTIAVSPSDRRAPLNARAAVRRMLAADGLSPERSP